jgi:hypothetical protein
LQSDCKAIAKRLQSELEAIIPQCTALKNLAQCRRTKSDVPVACDRETGSQQYAVEEKYAISFSRSFFIFSQEKIFSEVII